MGTLRWGGGFEDGKEAGIVEEEAVGGSVEEGTGEAVLGDAAVEFGGGGGWVFEGEGGEAGEAGGVGADGLGELVVDVAGEDGGGGGIEGVEAHGG